MKIIHCADLHLGSALRSRFTQDQATEIRSEVRNSFHRLAEYAKQNKVTKILLSGDVFDSDSPDQTDKSLFYGVVKDYPEITFYYLRGNHDGAQYYGEQYDNLKTFEDSWTYYEEGDVVIAGIEIDQKNCDSMYGDLRLDAGKKNIVMLHGQTEAGAKAGAHLIYPARLKGKNIDYLALGHIHSYKEEPLDSRGVSVYSGCLQGRGYDETGEKGFVLIDTDGGISHTFVPFATRVIEERDIDLTGTASIYDARTVVDKAVKADKNKLLRLNLTGEVGYDRDELESEISTMLKGKLFSVSVKDKTSLKADCSKYEGTKTLKGEFISGVKGDSTLTDEQKEEILDLGLKALSGKIKK